MEINIQFFKDQISKCDKIINSDKDCVNVFFAKHKKKTLQELIIHNKPKQV